MGFLRRLRRMFCQYPRANTKIVGFHALRPVARRWHRQPSDERGADERIARDVLAGWGGHVALRHPGRTQSVIAQHDVWFARFDQNEDPIRLAPHILACLRPEIAIEAIDTA